MARRIIRGSLTVAVASTPVSETLLTGLTGTDNNALKLIGVELDLPEDTGIDNMVQFGIGYGAITGNIEEANTICNFMRNTILTTSGLVVVDNRVYIDLSMLETLIFQESFVVRTDMVVPNTISYRLVFDDAKITQDQKIAILALLQ